MWTHLAEASTFVKYEKKVKAYQTYTFTNSKYIKDIVW